MADPLLDELSPTYVRSEAIAISLADPMIPARAFRAIDLLIDYAQADRLGGVVVPLELTITPPSASGFVRHVFYRKRPASVSFVPKEGGDHLVRLAEVGHNLFFGALVVRVAGERADPRDQR